MCQMKLWNCRIQLIKKCFVIIYNLRSRRWEREEREEGKANSLKKTYTLVLMYISCEILYFNKLVRTFGSVNISMAFKIIERTELGFKESLWFCIYKHKYL